MRPPRERLLLITDRNQARLPLVDIAAGAIAAGCRWISLREKDLPPLEQKALATALVAVAGTTGTRVTLHGEPELAHEIGLAGVHLGAGGDTRRARAIMGAEALIGLSVHAGEAPGESWAAADYLIIGPVFATASKPGYGPALAPEGLTDFISNAPLPVVAIGGIDSSNAADCIEAGAIAVAVMGGVMRAEQPKDAVLALMRALGADEPEMDSA